MNVKQLMEILNTVDEEAVVIVSDSPGRGCRCCGYIVGVTDETFREEVYDKKRLKEMTKYIKKLQKDGYTLNKKEENILNKKTIKAIELSAFC